MKLEDIGIFPVKFGYDNLVLKVELPGGCELSIPCADDESVVINKQKLIEFYKVKEND